MSENILGNYLKKKRTQAGLSQRQVAGELGYTSPQFVSNWERGLATPPVKTLKKIGQIYGVSEKELFNIVLKNSIEHATRQLERKFKRA